MNQQYPQQPQQPGWGAPQPPYGQPPQPPKKSSAGKIIGFGCLGIIGLFVVIVMVAALAGSGGGSGNSSSSKPDKATAGSTGGAKKDDGANSGSTKNSAKTVVFKVWGKAPDGALGPLDITYGSDSDTRKGTWKNGRFEATLPLNKKAMFYTVSAQLQGSGDIQCSVTIGDHTKTGHASGGYNICDAQLSAGLLGGWD
ncbi:hypothetical protein GCM10010389_28640 [Streptomyces echinoruber]|uniref:MmpS family membrane protein n=2 Tax=Streptomyces echinoruber TaxID=68898 RepID=A0A918R762_9ACTN|nr:hypothetical protein GCM10010389_28640 [Streptomyces echinoruber]